jgi:hypothetical protein
LELTPLREPPKTMTKTGRRNNDELSTPLIDVEGSGMIPIPASLRSDFIHITGTPIHIALESTIHITGIGTFVMVIGARSRTMRLWARQSGCSQRNEHGRYLSPISMWKPQRK